MLKFEELGDRNNFINLQQIRFEFVAHTVQNNCYALRTHATEATQRYKPFSIKSPISSLFFEFKMSLNGEKVSTTIANFAHKNFIETEFSHGIDGKQTWLACQRYY